MNHVFNHVLRPRLKYEGSFAELSLPFIGPKSFSSPERQLTLSLAGPEIVEPDDPYLVLHRRAGPTIGKTGLTPHMTKVVPEAQTDQLSHYPSPHPGIRSWHTLTLIPSMTCSSE